LAATLVFLLLDGQAWGQGAYQLGLLPALNVNKKLGNSWSLNSKLEARQVLRSRAEEGTVDRRYAYVLTDLSLIAARRVGLDSRIAGGYLMRLEDGSVAHRFIQQFIVVQRRSGYRLAHRFVSDQTFTPREAAQIRLRYRITPEIPLEGQAVDPGEFYLKLNNEYVNSLQASEYDLEIRLVPLLGRDLSKGLKLEAGLDYRIDGFLDNNTAQDWWITVNVFVDL
jgi:hypothetical protein